MNIIHSALQRLLFVVAPREAISDCRYNYVFNGGYKIYDVKDYKHPVTGRKIQIISVYSKRLRLPRAIDIIKGFDLSICRFFATVNSRNELHLLPREDEIADIGIDVSFEALKRRVFTLNPVLLNTAKTAERIAKYYERGYHMEASVACVSCKHAETRALTLDEALGYVLAGDSKPIKVVVKKPEPKNTVETVATAIVSKTLKEAVAEVKVAQEAPRTPPRKAAAEPVCPPAPERLRQTPHLTVAEGAVTGGGSAIPTPPEIAPVSLPYARYYKDLTPLLGEQLINVNVEANGHLQTFRLYESVLRRAMTALGSKGAGKVLEMIKEMSRSSQTTY